MTIDRLRGFIVDAPGPNAYPLAIYTWIIACPAGLTLAERSVANSRALS